MKYIAAVALALMLSVAAPANAGLTMSTVYKLTVDGSSYTLPATTGAGVPNLPIALGWKCTVTPEGTKEGVGVRVLACQHKSGATAAAVVVCARNQRDIDVQRIAIGTGDQAVLMQLSCVTDYLQES